MHNIIIFLWNDFLLVKTLFNVQVNGDGQDFTGHPVQWQAY